MKIVFAGTPAVALPTLDAIHSDHEIGAVVTREDAPQGRKRVLTPSPVAAHAVELGLTVIAANRLGPDVSERIARLQPDLGVIVAYGGLVREPLLSTPRLGWINLHFSLLPRWRGAAPVQWSIIGGDRVSGATVFRLVPELDAGPILGTVEHPIGAHETAGHLLGELAQRGATLTRAVVAGLAAGTIVEAAQHGEVTLAPKLSIDDARIDWSLPADDVYRRIRGTSPEPGPFTTVAETRLKILESAPSRDQPTLPPGSIELVTGRVLVGTADHPIELVRVQPSGKTGMSAADWWRGISRAESVVAV